MASMTAMMQAMHAMMQQMQLHMGMPPALAAPVLPVTQIIEASQTSVPTASPLMDTNDTTGRTAPKRGAPSDVQDLEKEEKPAVADDNDL